MVAGLPDGASRPEAFPQNDRGRLRPGSGVARSANSFRGPDYFLETRISSTTVFIGMDWPCTAIVMSIEDFCERKQPLSVE